MPPLLVSMSLVTGLVDAFSYLVLGHVFVAKMTGDIVLLGFALVIVIVSTVFGETVFASSGGDWHHELER